MSPCYQLTRQASAIRKPPRRQKTPYVRNMPDPTSRAWPAMIRQLYLLVKSPAGSVDRRLAGDRHDAGLLSMLDRNVDQVDHGKLLLAISAGDRSALKALYEAEAPRMKGVARRMLRRDDLAEEALQDAFVRIWQKAWQYDPDRGSALGWTYTVQRSVALNILRSGEREDVLSPEEVGSLKDMQSVFQTADDIWERLATRSRLRRCLSNLDPVKRRAVLLSYALGLSHGEIAGRLSSPLGTVKAWLRRGLASLRVCMS